MISLPSNLRVFASVFFASSLIAGPKSCAAIIITAPTAVAAGSFEITQDFTIILTSTETLYALLLDGWGPGDGSQNLTTFSSGLLYSRNGGAVVQTPGSMLSDKPGAEGGLITTDDRLIVLNTGTGVPGANTITFKAGSWTLSPTANFAGAGTTQTFTGNVYAMGNFNSLVGVTTVPEPSALITLGLSTLGLTLRRRRAD